ncbi:MAG: class I SAM-dependent methyltransferase [Candidatus Dormibacteraceae bacterium]
MKRSLLTPFTCWECGARLSLDGPARLSCPQGHVAPDTAGGIFDLWPPGQRSPRIDTYGTPLGWAYDYGVNNRTLAAVTARLEWGTDIGRMYRLMAEGLACNRGEFVLDVPVGGGTTYAEGATALEGTLVGIDLSPVMLARASRRRLDGHLQGHVLLARGDATRLPLADRSVDRVLCFNGLHVIADKAGAMAEFRRVLKPGGELLGTVLVSDARPPYGALIALERLAGFFVPVSSGEIRSVAKRSGFERWQQDLEGALLYFRGG